MVRFKNRYLVVEVNPTNSANKSKFVLKPQSLYAAIIEKLQQLHGDFGVAATRSGFLAKYCNQYTRVAFIRVRHGPHKLVSSSLPLVTQVERTAVTLKTLYTGASLMQCNKYLVNHQKKQLQKIWPKLKSDDEKNCMQEAFLKLRQLAQE